MSASVGFKVNSATAREIAGHLGRCDDLFIPPLSSHTEIDGYAQKIRRHAVRFEAWAEGNLVGLVAAYLNDEERGVAYVTNVSVEARYRRTGIASELIARCIRGSERRGFERIELEVDGSNTAAVDLYRKHGFAVRGLLGRTIVMCLDTGRG